MSQTGREIQLAARPHGEPTPDDFRLVEVEVPDPAEGQVLVRNLLMSVDPYMRGRMNDVPSYVPPFRLDKALDGAAVGEVIASGPTASRRASSSSTTAAGASTPSSTTSTCAASTPRSRRRRRSSACSAAPA